MKQLRTYKNDGQIITPYVDDDSSLYFCRLSFPSANFYPKNSLKGKAHTVTISIYEKVLSVITHENVRSSIWFKDTPFSDIMALKPAGGGMCSITKGHKSVKLPEGCVVIRNGKALFRFPLDIWMDFLKIAERWLRPEEIEKREFQKIRIQNQFEIEEENDKSPISGDLI